MPVDSYGTDDSYGTTDRRKNPLISSPGRRAMLYTAVIIALALLITAVFAPLSADSRATCSGEGVFSCLSVNRYIFTFVPSLLLAFGGIGAFVKTYSVWQSGGPWKVWHASGWFLFIVMMVFASGAAGSLMS